MICCSHWSKDWLYLELTLCFNNFSSLTKTALLSAISGWMSLKMKALRVTQIAQQSKIAVSIKNCEWIASLRNAMTLGNSSSEGMSTPRISQHCFANSHCKKRWCTISSMFRVQRTHRNYYSIDNKVSCNICWVFYVSIHQLLCCK